MFAYQHLFAYFKLLLCILAAAVSAVACGGGGGDGDSPRTPETVVFLADKDTDGANELYAVGDDGNGLQKISGDLVSGGSVVYFKLSPDGAKVAYSAHQDTAGVIELYVVNIDGSNPIKVSQGLGPDADVYQGDSYDAFWWSPDSTRLVYLADADIDEIRELYLVNADGSDHHKISGFVGGPPPVVQIGQAKWSPDGRYVAYYVRTLTRSGLITDRFAINTHDTTIGGQDSVRVSGSVDLTTSYDSIHDMAWSPDSSQLAYVSFENTAGVRELYIATPGVSYTSPSQQVNVPLTGNQGVHFRFHWSSDGRYLLYSVDGNTPGGLYTHDTQNATPRNASKISGDLAAGGRIHSFAWSPDDSRVAYRAEQDTDGMIELYSALPDTADSAVKLSGPLPSGGNVSQFNWSPDSTQIAYVADQDTDNDHAAYTVAADGGSASVRVSAPIVSPNSGVGAMLTWSPNGQLLAYEVTGSEAGLFVTTPDDNSAARRITNQLFTPYTVFSYQSSDEYGTRDPWSSDGQVLIFRAIEDPLSDPAYLLYRTDIDDNQSPVINGSLVAGGSVASFDY